MIAKDNFTTIMHALDLYWNEKHEHLQALGIYENCFEDILDSILTAIESDIDPKHTARDDEITYDSGSYLCDWLFAAGIRDKCPTAADLYDYVAAKYQS